VTWELLWARSHVQQNAVCSRGAAILGLLKRIRAPNFLLDFAYTHLVWMAEPVKEVPIAEAEKAAAPEVKADSVAHVAPSGVSAAMEHMKAAAAALVPGSGQAEGAAEPGMAHKLQEAKDIAHEAANDVKGAMGKISGLFSK